MTITFIDIVNIHVKYLVQELSDLFAPIINRVNKHPHIITRGYKAFYCYNPTLYTKQHTFAEENKNMSMNGMLVVGAKGFHFCDNPVLCYQYFKRESTIIYEIEVLGQVLAEATHNEPEYNNYCTNSYRLVKPVNGQFSFGAETCIFSNGHLHSIDQPAYKEKYDSSTIFQDVEEWRKEGHLHREGGPAYTNIWGGYHAGKKVIYKKTNEWWINGMTSRENGPVIEEIDSHNNTRKQEWAIGDDYYTIDGPLLTSSGANLWEHFAKLVMESGSNKH